ncbi:MAG: agmatine deiminase family protein [Anaerolineae bacterium]|nr:agmatine deiminase family protein [Anaerolineae bacterium]
MKRRGFLRFEYVVYPVWRRRLPDLLKPLAGAAFRALLPVEHDENPPATPEQMAAYLTEWDILDGDGLVGVLADCPAVIETVDGQARPPAHDGRPVRVPAQWEPQESVLISFGCLYPPVWPMHARMIEAISQVATAEVLVSSPLWARAVWVYLQRRGLAHMARVRLLVLPTNDIWIRDYGPIIGFDPDGRRVAVDPVYAVLPDYPQHLDNGMTIPWAAHRRLPVQPLPLDWEGGNLWTDGRGTLITTEQIFYSNPWYDRAGIEAFLHRYFAFDKLIITPRLTLEETGHVDMLVRLATPETVLVSAPEATTAEALRKTRRLFERETNAHGQPYQVIDLPTPPLYLNWFVYTVRRSYTNALLVNGAALVPVYGLALDDIALRRYEQALPGWRIIPVDSRAGINGGGAVHCMTREIPAG